jgi:sugar phosphate isomerase/epimerase
MPPPNPLVLFNNHFAMHRRNYPMATRLAIAADVGYDGFEFHPTEPTDDTAWSEMESAYRASGLRLAGMYVVAKGINDDEADQLDAEIARVNAIIDRLAVIDPRAFLNLTLMSNPAGRSTPDYRDAGSARAETRHWERTATMLRAVDAHLARRGLSGNLYNHIWFMIDTPEAEIRALAESEAKVIRPGLATFHAHFHLGVPDLPDCLAPVDWRRLGYLALLNGWPKPAEPFRTRPLDDGNIDIAAWLGCAWSHGYTGPIVSQAYDLGGDPYLTAQRSLAYIREVHARFTRNPALNPCPASSA